jgi:hypothetical protein
LTLSVRFSLLHPRVSVVGTIRNNILCVILPVVCNQTCA